MSTSKPVKERVTTIGEGGSRFWLYPAKFSGAWLNRRRWVAYILIVIFFITPWTKVNGHQTILMDLTERKLSLFGWIFWPQDTLIFWCFLVGTVIAIFLITAWWGRLWCGWACPQTVFLEHVFRRIETWIEGDANQRRRLDKGPLTFTKFRKKALKYFVFLIIASHFANTVLCYFVGTEKVLKMTFQPPSQNWGWFVFMAFFNFLFFLDFTWFREQFCLIACPYGRFQSALLDQHSMIVAYDPNRGEPRQTFRKDQDRSNIGSCIDCNRCVAVCPTGIDIRHGLQMECINCTACIDACDEIMEKTHQPKGLIRYTSIADLEGIARRFLRPRVIAYSLLLVVLWGSGTYLLTHQQPLRIQLLRPRGSSFTLAESESVISNHFHAKATNQSDQTWVLKPSVPEGYEVVTAFSPWTIPPQKTAENQIFIRKTASNFSKEGKETVSVTFYQDKVAVFTNEVTLIGPQK